MIWRGCEMAQHIITISDEADGISIRLESKGPQDSMAGITAQALIAWTKTAIPAAAKKATLRGTCTCDGCKAMRALAEAETSPTIH